MPQEDLQKNIDRNFGNVINPEPQTPKSPVMPGTSSEQSRRLKTLRTFQGDMDEALVGTKASIISIAVAEQKRATEIEKKIEQTEPTREKEKRSFINITDNLKNKLFIYLGSILLVLAVIITVTIYYNSKSTSAAPEKVNKSDTIISYNLKSSIDIYQSNSSILSDAISRESKKFDLPVNSVLYLSIEKDKNIVPVSDFLTILSPNIPTELVRNLADEYMIGIYSFDTNEPFIILKANDFGLAYSGMLKWENSMTSDLGQLFNLKISSSTNTFSDEALRNKDLRIVKNEAGKTVLLYSFVNKNTILITSNERIFNAILAKYITGELIR